MSKSKPKPTATPHKVPTLHMRLPVELDDALSEFIADQLIPPDRTAVGIKALEELLTKHGYWPPKPPAKPQ